MVLPLVTVCESLPEDLVMFSPLIVTRYTGHGNSIFL